ncbi:MAG: calcium-binding protein [Planctomycetes bacterium]|nr:calcium-binding protein [Planctomycetota bacterium]
MQRTQQTTSRFTRLCQIGAVLLCVPILMAIGCPLTVTVTCPADGTAGTAATVTVTVSGGQGAATWTTAATNGTVADGAVASLSVTPDAEGTVTVSVTATDEAGTEAMDSCTFDAVAAACVDDTDCDDGDVCTTDTCTDGTCDNAAVDGCCNSDADCAEGEVCVNNACATPCADDADCDDGDPCNGAETCDATDALADGAGCVAGTAPTCDDSDACTTDTCDGSDAGADADGCVFTAMDCGTQTCVNGVCVDPCVSAADCDDSDPCTDDSCVANACVNTAKDCDDGLFCTGTNTCNAGTGVCEVGTDPCATGTTCNEATDTCDDEVACTDDAGCDDGVFCNGAETCDLTDPAAGICAAGTDPCAADEDCNEGTDFCDPPTGGNFRLTLQSDTFTPTAVSPDNTTSGNDTFDATREVSSGVLFQTLNNGDNLDGGNGTDTINVEIIGATNVTTTPSSLAKIEIFNIEITDTTDAALNVLNADAISEINNKNSTANLTVTNVSTAPTTFGISNANQNFTVNMTNTALAGTGDTATVNISGSTVAANEPIVTLQPTTAASGYETFNLVSSGGVGNVVEQVTDGNGTTLATMNISGSQDLQIIVAVDATCTTVDASGASGKIDVVMPTANMTVTGGSNDDTFRFPGNYDTNDTVDGGAGTDTLVVTSAQGNVTTAQTNVSNMETLEISDALVNNIDITYFVTGSSATLATGVTGTQIVEIRSGDTVTVEADASATLTIAVTDATGETGDTTTDTCTVVLDNADITTNLDAPEFEDMTLESKTAANAINGNVVLNAPLAGDQTLTIIGATGLTLGDTLGTDTVAADAIDASGMTGSATLTMNSNPTVACTITGTANNDTLYGSTSGDIINGGTGNDIIGGWAGADIMSGGAGNDTFNMANGDTDDATVTDTISDFDAGTSTTAVDTFTFDESSLEAFTGPTQMSDTSNFNVFDGDAFTVGTLSADGGIVAAVDLVIIPGDYADASVALAAQTSWTITYGAALDDNDAFLIAYKSGSNVRIAMAVNNGVASATSDLVNILIDLVTLTGVTVGNLDSTDFNLWQG